MGGEPGQYRKNPAVGDALLAAAYEWTKFGNILKSSAWMTEDLTAMVAGGSVKNQRDMNVCMPSGFLADVEPPAQSAET